MPGAGRDEVLHLVARSATFFLELLDLQADGRTTIKAVTQRAWEEWLWHQESRVQRTESYRQDLSDSRPSVEGQKAWQRKAPREQGISALRVAWQYA